MKECKDCKELIARGGHTYMRPNGAVYVGIKHFQGPVRLYSLSDGSIWDTGSAFGSLTGWEEVDVCYKVNEG